MEDKQNTTQIAFQTKDTTNGKKPPHKKRKIIAVVLTMIIGWTLGSVFPIKGLTSLRRNLFTATGFTNTDKLETVRNILDNDWYFAKDIENIDDRIVDNAINGMVNNPEDIHTSYMTKEESKEFLDSINRDFVGIGVEVTMFDNKVFIHRVIDNSPAKKAGLLAGDIITKVDNTDVKDMTLTEIKDAIQGEKGSQVVIQVERDNTIIPYTLTREEILDTSSSHMIDDTTVYVHLYQFGNSTHDELEQQLNEMIGGKSKVNMILDLRNNGGGLLESVRDVASLFLQKGDVILQEEDKDGNKTVHKANGKRIENIDKIVILVNNNTASASEIMTLALKENLDNVTIVGKTTYGKGTAQQTVYLKDGTALKYTVARWLSAKGVWVNQKGIEPDISVDLPDVQSYSFAELKNEATYKEDSVSAVTKGAQLILQYLNYPIERTDGYYSSNTNACLSQFASDHNISFQNEIDETLYDALYAKFKYTSQYDTTLDTQYQKASEVIHG